MTTVLTRFVVGVMLALAALSGHAATIIYDPSNYAKNALSAIQTVKSVAEQVKAYTTQLLQYQAALQQLTRAGPGDLLGLAFNNPEAQAALQLYQSLQSLQGSLQQARNAVDFRVNEARTSGMSFANYAQYLQRQVGNGNTYLKTRLDNERRILQRVQTDYESAQQFAASVPGTVGIHQGMGVLNGQMNRMLAQNAQVIEILGVTLPQGQNMLDDLSLQDEAARQGAHEQARSEIEASRQRSLDTINAWGK